MENYVKANGTISDFLNYLSNKGQQKWTMIPPTHLKTESEVCW